MSKPMLTRLGFYSVAVATVLALVATVADARPGRGGGIGSRGDRTFSAPPTTNTAPKAAAPIDKSIAQPGTAAAASKGAAGASAAAGAATQASRFGGMRGLLLGGLFAAGLAGIFGVGALASALGFMLQFLLIGGLIWLAYSFFRSRSGTPQPVMAGAAASPPRARQATQNVNLRAGTAAGGTGAVLDIGPADFDAFQARLGDIQAAYGRNDVSALGDMVTPEMLSYFAQELSANTQKGVRNEVSDATLLQGDLAESWREASGEYASVAMRYSVLDAVVDTATGRVLSGSRTTPEEVVEVWTFRRTQNGKPSDWELSAIQQA